MRPGVRARVAVAMLLGLSSMVSKAALAEQPWGAPKANTEVDSLVDFQMVKKIAIMKAQLKWGLVALGPVLPACDEDGDIVAYVFPFAIGAQSFPEHSELLGSVKQGRRMAQQGLSALSEAEKMKVRALVTQDEAVKDTARRGFPRSHEVLADEKAKRLGREKMIGAGAYGTVVVSARYDRFPVPVYLHHLPPALYQGDLAAEKAAGALSSDSVTLERIYFLESLRAMYAEYSANGQSVLLHAYHLGQEPRDQVLAGKGAKRKIAEPLAKARLDEEWSRVRLETER